MKKFELKHLLHSILVIGGCIAMGFVAGIQGVIMIAPWVLWHCLNLATLI